MKKTIHCCTKCGAEKITVERELSKYRKIVFAIGEFDSDYVGRFSSGSDYGKELNTMYLCPDCYTPLGISDLDSRISVNGEENIKSTSEKLYEVFVELLEELNSNN